MTKLIVAQRISTIMDADLILVLDQGKVVGQGTHKELLATNEVYQEIAYSQLSKEELEHGNKKMSLWKQCRPFLAGLQLPLLIAVVAAICSSIITVYGPTKIKEITN